MTRRRLPAFVAAFVLLAAAPTFAYLKFGTRVQNRTVGVRWTSLPVRYFVTNRSVPQVSAQQFQTTMARAFATWRAVETVDLSAEFVGFTGAPPFASDGMTVLGFDERPDLERALGVTNLFYDATTGEILEVGVFFNSTFPWSVEAAGVTGRHDLESIAVHEIGHLLGLGHSALGETEIVPGGRRVIGAEAVMFPVAFAAGTIHDRNLKADDIAGITDIYSTAAGRRTRGSISGRVTKNGAGVPGSHVVAFNLATGKLVGGFTLNNDGTFTIAGLEPGAHVLRAEPLDDGDLTSFFEASFDVDLDFRVRFHDRIVVVPRGGGARDVEIRVTPK